jgi:NAD(P)-dependent dehydrogenase (short-subunit alcohol dehydrogenase family)
LNGKAVVITGSGQGIGAACARGAARQGAAVVVNDIIAAEAHETAEAIRAEGGTAVACVADVSKWEDAQRLIRACIEAFGKIDGLVNNAALIDWGRIDEFDPEAARSLVDVNVLGTMYCSAQAVIPMLAQGSGSIVNVTSGAHMGMPKLGIYGATKGAVASMIYTWAIELAGTGVRVNGLSPFATGTRMSGKRGADPMMQKPEANSPVLEYLLSDLASHVNGQIVRIDQEDLSLYTHPALLLPPAVRSKWTAETVAGAFANEFKDRQVVCGVMGMESLPVNVRSGFWKGKDAGHDLTA